MKVNTTATMTVIRSRFRSTTVEPAIEPPVTAAEHVGEPAAPTRVQQDQDDEDQRHDDVEDENDGVQHGMCAPFTTAGTLTGIVGKIRISPNLASDDLESTDSVGKADDPCEIVGVEGCATHERAVDVGLGP